MKASNLRHVYLLTVNFIVGGKNKNNCWYNQLSTLGDMKTSYNIFAARPVDTRPKSVVILPSASTTKTATTALMTTTTLHASSVFNGGKMKHIFEFAKEPGSKRPTYKPTFSSLKAQDAFENSKNWFWKIDGSCGLLRYCEPNRSDEDEKDSRDDGCVNKGVLEVYERRDTRGKDPAPHFLPLPTKLMIDTPKGNDGGENDINDEYNKSSTEKLACSNESSYVGPNGKPHSYYLRKTMVEKATGGKKQKKSKQKPLDQKLLDVLTDNRDELIDKIKMYGTLDGWLSVELVGFHFQQTPGVPDDTAIAIHAEQRIALNDGIDGDGGDNEVTDNFPPRTFDNIKEFLLQRNVEGIVLEHEGTYWKIRSNLMDPRCKFNDDRSNANPPTKLYTRNNRVLNKRNMRREQDVSI